MNIRLALIISVLILFTYFYIVGALFQPIVRATAMEEKTLNFRRAANQFKTTDLDTIKLEGEEDDLKFKPALLGLYTIIFSIIASYFIYGMLGQKDKYTMMAIIASGAVLLLVVTGALEYLSFNIHVLFLLVSLAFMAYPTVGTVSAFLPTNPMIIGAGILTVLLTLAYNTNSHISKNILYAAIAANCLFVYLAFRQVKQSYRYGSKALILSFIMIPMIIVSSRT